MVIARKGYKTRLIDCFFKLFQIVHVPREQNSEADALVRQVLKKASQDGRCDANGVAEESPSSKG